MLAAGTDSFGAWNPARHPSGRALHDHLGRTRRAKSVRIVKSAGCTSAVRGTSTPSTASRPGTSFRARLVAASAASASSSL